MVIDRKQQIIEAATHSFSLFGYKATTMDQVAKIANVGKGTIYTFFKNKEELFDEIIHSLINEMKLTADEVIDPSLSFHENVHRVLYKILEFRRKHQLTIKLIQEAREMGTPAVMEVMERLEEAIIHYLKDKISLAVEKGNIQPCDPELTAFIMLKLYFSLVFDWEKRHKPLEKEEIARIFEQYIFTGLSKG
ncbi:TetR/AcrR family transcriptional regulator [Cytobacillus depressus]|uniref:TetR/AcrR family transcriptional regulator n=1 Tax=Cytobacillus depressus TaxID=1602942 RepID=A0A6L3V8M0_9BACI|nr:TetR/AcrR family transcriptional regulator [Cytobacillus depressus]KAB2337145.1 TetR/AcrR family transcriptional regulator [Cytobacillus depressus]